MLIEESFASYRKVCHSFQKDWMDHVPVPEIVICGSQGSGKKTLMENIVCYPIPSKLSLPVRCCLRSTGGRSGSCGDGNDASVAGRKKNSKSEGHSKNGGKDGEGGRGKRNSEVVVEVEVVDSKSGTTCCARRRIAGRELAKSCYEELMEEATGYAKTAGTLLSSMTLNVHLTSSSNPCLDVVLFPGLLAFNQTEDEKRAESLIRDHIANRGPRSFYLLTVEASMRLNTALIMRSFTNRDDLNGLVVFTKFSLVRSFRGKEEWSDFRNQVDMLLKFRPPSFVCTALGGIPNPFSSESRKGSDEGGGGGDSALASLHSLEEELFRSQQELFEGLIEEGQLTFRSLVHRINQFYTQFSLSQHLPVIVFVLLHTYHKEQMSKPGKRCEKTVRDLTSHLVKLVDEKKSGDGLIDGSIKAKDSKAEKFNSRVLESLLDRLSELLVVLSENKENKYGTIVDDARDLWRTILPSIALCCCSDDDSDEIILHKSQSMNSEQNTNSTSLDENIKTDDDQRCVSPDVRFSLSLKCPSNKFPWTCEVSFMNSSEFLPTLPVISFDDDTHEPVLGIAGRHHLADFILPQNVITDWCDSSRDRLGPMSTTDLYLTVTVSLFGLKSHYRVGVRKSKPPSFTIEPTEDKVIEESKKSKVVDSSDNHDTKNSDMMTSISDEMVDTSVKSQKESKSNVADSSDNHDTKNSVSMITSISDGVVDDSVKSHSDTTQTSVNSTSPHLLSSGDNYTTSSSNLASELNREAAVKQVVPNIPMVTLYPSQGPMESSLFSNLFGQLANKQSPLMQPGRQPLWVNPPELVICGDQGSGKRTLMENIVSYPIPSKIPLPVRCCLRTPINHVTPSYDCCTKECNNSVIPFPVIPQVEAEVEVVDSKSGTTCCARRRIAGRELAKSCYEELMEEATGYAKTAGTLLSSMTLNVHLTSSSNPCLDVVLFPGLLAFNQTEDEKRAESLIRDHIANRGPRSFYLLTVEASMRLNTALIMRSFTNRDDVKGLVVFTKASHIESELQEFLHRTSELSQVVPFRGLPRYVCLTEATAQSASVKGSSADRNALFEPVLQFYDSAVLKAFVPHVVFRLLADCEHLSACGERGAAHSVERQIISLLKTSIQDDIENEDDIPEDAPSTMRKILRMCSQSPRLMSPSLPSLVCLWGVNTRLCRLEGKCLDSVVINSMNTFCLKLMFRDFVLPYDDLRLTMDVRVCFGRKFLRPKTKVKSYKEIEYSFFLEQKLLTHDRQRIDKCQIQVRYHGSHVGGSPLTVPVTVADEQGGSYSLSSLFSIFNNK